MIFFFCQIELVNVWGRFQDLLFFSKGIPFKADSCVIARVRFSIASALAKTIAGKRCFRSSINWAWPEVHRVCHLLFSFRGKGLNIICFMSWFYFIKSLYSTSILDVGYKCYTRRSFLASCVLWRKRCCSAEEFCRLYAMQKWKLCILWKRIITLDMTGRTPCYYYCCCCCSTLQGCNRYRCNKRPSNQVEQQ